MSAPSKVRPWDGTVVPFTPTGQQSCAGEKDVPYEPGRKGNAVQRQFQAKVCATCPMLVACAAHAMNNEPYGLWGLTEHQRGNLGGVVPVEWSNRVMDPVKALDELDEAGIGLDIVKEIVKAAGIKHREVLRALRDRTLAEKAELEAYKTGGTTATKTRTRLALQVAS